MKARRKVWVALIAGGGLAAVGWVVWAQTAELQVVESPPKWGTFYSLQKTNEPPFPFDPFPELPLYSFGNDIYVFDDREVDYVALAQQALALRMLEAAALGMTLAELEANEGEGPLGCDYSPEDLWLELLGLTNATAFLTIHPPWNVTNGVFDLQYATDLTPPISWQWVLRTDPGQTNLAVPNATDAQGFYRLAPPNDLTANSSLGTNFWTGFSCMDIAEGAYRLSLYISSRLDATGTVTTLGAMTNGPVLVVTNCGDATVNGTYVLTNLTAQQQADLETNGVQGVEISYENGTNWVVFYVGLWWMMGYDSGYPPTFKYYTFGIDLNGSNADWYSCGDTNLPTPTTVCAHIPFSQSFTVAAGAVTNINIPSEAMMVNYDVVKTNGIQITASQPVAVYASAYSPVASAAFTCYSTRCWELITV